jgi:hypothetical protein
VPIGSLFVVAGIIESVLGLLITIGLFTSYAAFIVSVKWPSLISSAISRKVFDLLKTRASRRCFYRWRRRVPGSGVSMERAIEIPVRKVS